MPGSKYERELRFIDTETARLNYLKTQLMESMPADPAEAAEKLKTVQEMEAQIAQHLDRKKVIEDSPISESATAEALSLLIHRSVIYLDRSSAYYTVPDNGMTKDEATEAVIRRHFEDFGIFLC